MKSVTWLLPSIILFLAAFSEAEAYQVPGFTSCINPKGETKANYETGTHGIVGSSASYSGRDTVYALSGNALTQCFCSSDGKGIQTNWWKASSLTEGEIKALKSQGWNFVPNGALWGLEGSPYLAFNSEYICKSSSGDGGGPTNGGSGGSATGITSGVGQVLGLASTGNIKFLLTVFSLAILSLLLGLIVKIRAKKFSN